MTLAAGQTLSHYSILGPLGAGAMGEVWRARDGKLGREVAIKVLPQQFTADAERLRRFEREAKTLASLNHSHIAQIFGVDQVGETCFLVLELVEGESLDERLKRGALPLDEALDVGRQIAEGLEAAHEAGVIHRDLKPANIRLTPDGRVKLLDFGLAKPAVQGRNAPTSTDSVLSTEHGRLLGTPTYMAPEQARAKPIDRRVDIWAFGCVLYECLTARRAFEGESMTDVLGAVLHTTPDLSTLPPGTPPAVRELLGRCLEKDPRRRLRDVGEARRLLERAATGADAVAPAGGGSATAASARRSSALPWGLAAVATAIAVVALLAAGRNGETSPAAVPVVRSSLTLAADIDFAGGDGSLALSPDGRTLVFMAARGAARRQLWLRPLDSLEPQPLAGTEGATYPFWSPDGRALAFFAGGKLRRMPAGGGSVTTICDAREPRGGTWGSDGTIVFAPAPFGPLLRVPSTGGTPAPVTQAEGQASHRLPHFAPDGRHLVFSQNNSEADGILWLDLETGAVSRIADDRSEGLMVGSDWLAFVRSRALMIQPFDAAIGKLTGEPRRMVDRVEFVPPRLSGAFALSTAGTLVYRSDPPSQRLEWFDLDGRSLGLLGDPAQIVFIDVSPDGTRVAAMLVTDDGGTDLWTFDAQRGLGSKQVETMDGFWFKWTPDGRQLAYTKDSGTEYETWLHPVDGSGPDRRVGTGISFAWSPDGQWTAIGRQQPGTDLDVYLARPDGSSESALLATAARETALDFSPDSRWILVDSDQSGRDELYAAPVDGKGPMRALTSSGIGGGAWWLPDGRLLFVSLSGKQLLEVSVTPSEDGAELQVGEPRPAFLGRELPSATICPTPDGKRLLAVVPGEQGAGDQLTLVQNWPAAIEGQ